MATNPQSFEHYEVKETSDIFLMVNEMNALLSRLGERIDELAGLRGPAKFYADIDAGGNKLTNVGAAGGPDDAETAKHSLRSSSATSPYDAGGKPVSNVGRAVNDSDAVPLGQMREEAELAGSNTVSTATPEQIDAGDAGAAGDPSSVAAGNHAHPIATASTAVALGIALSGGAATTFSRGDHVHTLGKPFLVVLTASLPAAAAAMDGTVLIENTGATLNLVAYGNGIRARLAGVAF